MTISKFISIALVVLLFAVSACKKSKRSASFSKAYVAVPAPPEKVKNTAGEWLAYELQLVTPSHIEKIEVEYKGKILLEYTDITSKDSLHLARIWLPYAAVTGDGEGILRHIIYYSNLAKDTTQFMYAVKDKYAEPKLVQMPLPPGIWMASGAPGASSYHTKSLFSFKALVFDTVQNAYLIGDNPQRFAIDFINLIDGKPYKNDGTKLTDWYCYDLPITAAAAGKVVYTKDGLPNQQTPDSLDYPTDTTNASGNVVYIEHDDGSIAMYAHLMPHSIIVKVGQMVAKGQLLARLGNSGNTTAPHLHFHLVANPKHKKLNTYADGLFMEGVPYVLPQFTKLGTVPLDYVDKKPISMFKPSMSTEYRNTLPAENDIIEIK